MTTPSKNLGGRPKRNRVLAETAFDMRRGGASLLEIQAWLNASGVKLQDCGDAAKPHYRGAARWAERGAATLKEFQTAWIRASGQLSRGRHRSAEGQELMDLARRRCLEAMEMLEKIADGQVPLVDADGRVIQMKGETEEEAARRAPVYHPLYRP